MANKFFDFKNMSNDTAELYFYGEFVTDKYSDDDITTLDFRNQLKEISNVKTLNMYFDSFGGNVFVANAIVSMLKRYKEEHNVTINAYVDSASASSASFLMMVADNIYLYQNSVVLIHKPMISAFYVNADELQGLIDSLNTMEDNIIIPLYMKHAKEGIDEQKIKNIMAKSEWLSAKETAEIFNVTIISESKQMVASAYHDKKILDYYKNIPEAIMELLNTRKDNNPDLEAKKKADEELALARAKMELEIAML